MVTNATVTKISAAILMISSEKIYEKDTVLDKIHF